MAKKNTQGQKPFKVNPEQLKAAIIASARPHEFYASGQYTPDMKDQVKLDPRYRAFISQATK